MRFNLASLLIWTKKSERRRFYCMPLKKGPCSVTGREDMIILTGGGFSMTFFKRNSWPNGARNETLRIHKFPLPTKVCQKSPNLTLRMAVERMHERKNQNKIVTQGGEFEYSR